MANGPVNVKADPSNPRTIVLDRWPTQREKTKLLAKEIAEARVGGPPTEPVDVPIEPPEPTDGE